MQKQKKLILPPAAGLRNDIEKNEAPELRYIVKSLGMSVRFVDGTIINMNRATRRKNKLYGNHVRRSGR